MGGLANRCCCVLVCSNSRQETGGRLPEHSSAIASVKAGDKTERLCRPPDPVPGDPDAVGVSQTGCAVMRGQLICSYDVLLQRRRRVRVEVLSVKNVHGNASVHGDGIGLALLVEVQPPTESTHSGGSGLVQHRVSPDRKYAVWHAGSQVFVEPKCCRVEHFCLASAHQ